MAHRQIVVSVRGIMLGYDLEPEDAARLAIVDAWRKRHGWGDIPAAAWRELDTLLPSVAEDRFHRDYLGSSEWMRAYRARKRAQEQGDDDE